MPTSTAAVPTAYQRALNALEIADNVRSTNAANKHAIKKLSHQDGCWRAASVLMHDDMAGPSGSMKVYDLLTSIRSVSEVKAGQILRDATRNGRAIPSGRLRDLRSEERAFLAGVLAMNAANSRGARTR